MFKGSHGFNRKIRNGKRHIKFFPAGGDTMIPPRKIYFHESIQKEKRGPVPGAKLGTCLARIALRLHPPQKILACLSLSRVVLHGGI